MIYRRYDELTVLEISNCVENISFEVLAEIISSKPSNVIYCEREGKLYGIISMGDIARARDMGLDTVPVNKCFTHIMHDEYMRARKIFFERDSINALPVISKEGVLLGDYSRWDDLLYAKYMLELGWKSIMPWYGNNSIVLVRPCSIFSNKQKLFRWFNRYLLSQGVTTKCIDYMEVIDYIPHVDWILFVDEDERRAVDTLLTFIYNKDFNRKRLRTYRKFIMGIDYEILNAYLEKQRSDGVHIVNLFYSENDDYSNLLKRRICDRFAAMGERVSSKMRPEMYPDFFGELYTKEYAEQILQIQRSVESKSGTGKLKDRHSKYYNVTNGERYTAGQPDFFTKSIYFFGPCFIYGHYVDDSRTIESFLQNRVNESGYKIRVVNCGSPSYSGHINLELARIIDTPFNRGDIIVLYSDNESIRGCENLDLMKILRKCDVSVMWMVDAPQHCNYKVNLLYADAIYDILKPVMEESADEKGELIEKDNDFVKLLYIDRYFADFDELLYNKIGAIVMNCNPFTYGHRYLIEQALNVVDFLIIFVVEEDRSIFSFAERFAMICEGVADLDRVKVVPGGSFILSQTTFPEYFIKEADEDIVENVENDITLFAEKIAPRLNIRYRFVGEEPDDAVTNEYNQAMKRILPKKGIELIEIPRKQMDSQFISASLVRKCLEDNDVEKLRNLVPESTRRMLFNNMI